MQEGVTIGNDAITGTLKYVDDYTGFSSKTEEQSGNYLVIHCATVGVAADTVSVELIGGTSGERTLDSDGIIVLRIKNTSQKVKVKAVKDGYATAIKEYSLTGITLNQS